MRKNHQTFVELHAFLWLWSSQSISAMGTAMTEYALVIWAYEQTGTAESLSMLTLCSFLPTILFRFIAGAVADRWNKKILLLTADLFAACGSLGILLLHTSVSLTFGWLYGINFLLSLMNAFQVPAAYVATSLLVPKEHYTKTGGLQAASGALISILSPLLGSVLLSFGGLEAVLLVDLGTFTVAWITLFFLPIPSMAAEAWAKKESLWQNITSGFCFLRRQPILFRLILLIAFVNFLAKLGSDGQMPAFILSRTDHNQAILGAVQSAMALGILAGGSLITILKPPKNDTRRILCLCTFIFLAGILFALSRNTVWWCIFAFLQYMCAAAMNVYWGARLRTAVPIAMQGRVFSTRDTIQNCTIPAGLYLGGMLADHVFEPVMANSSLIRAVFAPVLGGQKGAGIALLFLLVSALGFAVCGVCVNSASFREKKNE